MDEKKKKQWTDCAIAAKAEWEGDDYVLHDVDPDEVEDQELADWIRVGRVVYAQVESRLRDMMEACGGEDCEMCGGTHEDEGFHEDELDEDVCPECNGHYDPSEGEDECSCDDDFADDEENLTIVRDLK